MAILRNRATQRKIPLRTHHVFGRGHSTDTLLENPDASQLHASIFWTGTAWELRDHSRNGTVLDGVLQYNNSGLSLHVGSVIEFGRDHASTWVVEDLGAPSNLLWPVDHSSHPIPLTRSNLLPQGQDAEVSIHCNVQGQWIYTTPHGSWVLEDGNEVQFSDQNWCFIQMADVASTMDAVVGIHTLGNSRPTMHFHVSLDEEHVHLQMVDADQRVDLGERSHHYALLILARLRLKDAQLQTDSNGHGWIELERLAKMLGLDPGHLNIQIFRMRKQLALALPQGAHVPDLIERRRGSLRFGNVRFFIIRGSQPEANFDPLTSVMPIYAREALVA